MLLLFILTLQHLAQQREQLSDVCVGVAGCTAFPTFFCTAFCAPIEKAFGLTRGRELTGGRPRIPRARANMVAILLNMLKYPNGENPLLLQSDMSTICCPCNKVLWRRWCGWVVGMSPLHARGRDGRGVVRSTC